MEEEGSKEKDMEKDHWADQNPIWTIVPDEKKIRLEGLSTM